MQISDLYSIYLQYPEIVSDSRVCKPGSIFFALKGESFNGNEFAKGAIEKGCAYAVVDEEKHVYDDRFILVEDVLKALQELARYHREQLKIPVIGITGTNGKTTTKELLGAVLAKKYSIVYTKGNLNNHIGVPLTVLSIKPETEISIIEMGANHPGEIAFLCKIAQPTHGMITNIGKAHLEGFGSFEGVKKTKNELYEYIVSNNGIVFSNAENPILMDLLQNKSFISYGYKDNNYCKGELIENTKYLEAGIELWNSLTEFKSLKNSTNKCKFIVKSNLVGTYNLENLLAAVAIGGYFDVSPELITDAIKLYNPDNNRSQYIITEKNKIIMDAYNANPSSMEVALQNFISIQDEEKVLILGEMLELGDYSVEEHKKILSIIETEGFSLVFLVGKSFMNIQQSGFYFFENVDLLCEWIQKNQIINKTILIKGSRGNKLEKVIPYLQ